jgi:acyl-CoA synthetase (AMP-forming)/AMP-acid ligase II
MSAESVRAFGQWPGASVDEAELIIHCKMLIAAYKTPRSIEFRDELPFSGAGKSLKYQLREARRSTDAPKSRK